MRIQDPNLSSARTAEQRGVSGAQENVGRGSKGAGPSGGSSPDRVQISSLAEYLAVSEAGSAEREARVERLKKEVEAGRYQPDATQIARALVKEATAGEIL